MSLKPRIAVIVGSTRAGRLADRPAQWMMKQAQAYGEFDVELVDLRDHPMPFFDEIESDRFVVSHSPEARRWQELSPASTASSLWCVSTTTPSRVC